jgi:hypothetical protein
MMNNEALESAEARALAAEMALDRLKTYATDTFIAWDRDQDSKVGKRLMWMSGAGNEGYEPSLDWVHKPNVDAARETMRKAAFLDKLRLLQIQYWEARYFDEFEREPTAEGSAEGARRIRAATDAQDALFREYCPDYEKADFENLRKWGEALQAAKEQR